MPFVTLPPRQGGEARVWDLGEAPLGHGALRAANKKG
jgi:hypothetical protein